MEKTTEIVLNDGDTAAPGLVLGVNPIVALAREDQQEFEPVTEGYRLQYEHQNGRLYQGNSFD